MRALFFIAAASLAASAAAFDAPSDQTLVAERLASRASAVLDGILGPGRAKLLVEVRGERRQIDSQTEVLTPLNKEGSKKIKDALRLLDLPGYQKDHPSSVADKTTGAPLLPAFQKDFERSLRDAGFEIKKIEATAIFDAALTETEAAQAAELLPRLLRLDESRGDVLTVVRAPLRPAWKSAFSAPSDWRQLALAGLGLAGAVVLVLIISSAGVLGARVFAKELTNQRPPADLPAPPAPAFDAAAAAPLPELVPGAPDGLLEVVEAESAPQLGRRFDFLAAAEAPQAARVLAAETPADLAQVFAYLSKASPETAARLFSKLPVAVQADASAAILKLTALDPYRLSAIEERLEAQVANGLEGSERLAAILRRVSSGERAVLLGRLAGSDSPAAAELERRLREEERGAEGGR